MRNDVVLVGPVANAARAEFEAAGSTVLAARAGEEALELVRDACPDLVVADLRLDDMVATELLARIRGEWRTCKVPALVVVESPEDARLVAEACGGSTSALVPPVSLASVADAASSFSLRWRTVARR